MSSISELEKWLTKKVMRGERGAAELRQAIRAKGRESIIDRIAMATPPGSNPSYVPGVHGGREMAVAGEEAEKALEPLNLLDEVQDVPDRGEAFNRWHALNLK